MMKLNWIEFENGETGLKAEKIYFNPDVTLLVGLSGCGKTQILNAITKSFAFANNKSKHLSHFMATLGCTVGNVDCEWEYKIEASEESNSDLVYTKDNVLYNGKEIMKRDGNKVNLSDFDNFPNPKNTESLLSQYSQEDGYKNIIEGFSQLSPLDMDWNVRGAVRLDDFREFKRKIVSQVQQQRNFFEYSHFSIPCKLYIAKEFFYNDIYVKIFDYVKELFPEIEDIDVIEDSINDVYVTAIKVYGHNILQKEISNGMLKTIYYIVELITMKPDSLVLIDEFENGLGVNCIDVLVDTLLHTRNDLQFIITSHHPKIINGISSDKWRIIERDVSTVKNYSAREYNVEQSAHESYFNLLNRWEYEGKI